jgi:hypothetical protein
MTRIIARCYHNGSAWNREPVLDIAAQNHHPIAHCRATEGPKQRTALSRPAVTDLAGGTARVRAFSTVIVAWVRQAITRSKASLARWLGAVAARPFLSGFGPDAA